MAGGSSTRFLSEAHGRVGRWLRNKWHLDALIAIGGMAAVYASTHRNGARAAIKLLHSQYTRNEQARRRFLAEGYAANKVGHRNAVLVLDDDTTEDGEVYLVMELLEGESLEGRLERLGVMSPMEVLAIADQLLEVLACAHPKGILHRDIKPANIYLTRDGSVKLLDFGLARVRELSAEALDQSDGIVFGTVSYIAPEQARADNQNLDSRSDMWSIAATMFRALAGETVHPSTGPIIERLLSVARKPARSIASLAPHLPRPVIELVDRALAFDPEDRWPSANVMRVVVQDVMAQLQEEAEGGEMDIEAQQPASKRRNNTLPVTTRARTIELPTVRPGLGPGAADSGVQRPKTDPAGLSTRPRNLPPSEPAPPDGDETELDLAGLYDKAKAAPRNAGRSRTLLTKEGRAELRRILDARRAGTPAPEPEPAPEPRRSRRLAGPDTSGVGDIEVEFEDSIIEVTIDHTHGARPGPIAERISEPSSATPAPLELPPAQAPEVSAAATTPNDAARPSDRPEEHSEAAPPPSSASDTYPAISVDEDEGDEAEEADAEEDVPVGTASPATSKSTSNLRPPSIPPQQPVPSDSRIAAGSRIPSPTPAPASGVARGTGRSPQGEITRVGPPPRPVAASSEARPGSGEARPASESRPGSGELRSSASSGSRPAASESRPVVPAFGAREITKVGPAPVAPGSPPARESQRLPARPNAGTLHETMRGTAAPVTPVRGPKEDPRPATGVTAGLLNETIRPGAAPPPAQGRSGPLPVGRLESEPAKSTVFTAPIRPGSDAPRPEASTPARATSFIPPAGRMANPGTVSAPAATPAPATPAPAPGAASTLTATRAAATTPATAQTPAAATTPAGADDAAGVGAPAATAASSGSPATLRLPIAPPRSAPGTGSAAGQPSTSPAASQTTASEAGATSRAASSDTVATSRAAGTSPATSKAATREATATGTAAGANLAASKAATLSSAVAIPAANKAAASEATATGKAASTAVGKTPASEPAASKTAAASPTTSKTAASEATPASPTTSKTPASEAAATSKPTAGQGAVTGPVAAKPAAGASAASRPATSNIPGAKPAASTAAPTGAVAPPSGSPTTAPVVPAAPVVPTVSAPVSSPLTVPVVPASSPLTVPVMPVSSPITVPVVPVSSPITVPVVPASSPITVPVVPSRAPIAAPNVTAVAAPPVADAEPASMATPAAEGPEAAPEAPVAPAPARAGKSMFNPYPSLAGGARSEGSATAKTASYAAVGGAVSKDSSVVNPNPRTSPNAKTAPHAAVGADVSKDSTPGPQDSSSNLRTSNPAAKTAAYATVDAEAKPSEPARGPGEGRGKTGATPVLPFNFLRGGAKPGEPAEPPSEDPNRSGRKKP